jgi:hypothetical protein
VAVTISQGLSGAKHRCGAYEAYQPFTLLSHLFFLLVD